MPLTFSYGTTAEETHLPLIRKSTRLLCWACSVCHAGADSVCRVLALGGSAFIDVLLRRRYACSTPCSHVFRITKALGWTPPKANRETAFQHLDVRIPSENKYPVRASLLN